MIRKSVITGTWIGLLLSVANIFPAFYVFIGKALPSFGIYIERVFGDLLLPGGARISVTQPLMMALTAIITLLLLTIGTVAALRARAGSARVGLLCGAISGAFAGLVLYILIVAPTSTVMAGASLLEHVVYQGYTVYNSKAVVPFAQFTLLGQMRLLVFVVLGGAVLGGLEGALVGKLRRKHNAPPAPESLVDVVQARDGQRLWFRNYEEPVLSGLVTGVIGGFILVMTDFWTNASSVGKTDETSHWLAEIFAQAVEGVPLRDFQFSLLPVMVLLSVLVVVGMGGVAALLPKNPPGFLRARVFAAAVSGTVVGLIISMLLSSYLRFGLVILPQLMASENVHADVAVEVGEQIFENVIAYPEVRVLLIYLLPLPLILLVTLGYTFWGTVQGIFYTLLFALLKLRPVDRARAQQRQIREHPAQLLPRLHALFQKDSSAVQVLEHLAFDLRSNPDQARLVAAYHTLAVTPELAPRAFAEIAASLEANPDWKLRNEILALHRALDQGLAARTVAQVAMLNPLPEGQTSSLVPPLVKTGELLTKPLLELKKVERVDDLNTRIIFLSNALESLRQARMYCKTGAVEGYAAPLPEIDTLRLLVNHWEGIILATIRDIQGRAEVTAELKTRQITPSSEMALTMLLANRGLNVAEKVRVQIECGGEGCEIGEGGQQSFDILSPQETREIHLTLLAAGNGVKNPDAQGGENDFYIGPTRLCWTVSYGDALKPDYVLEFADQVEFVEQEKPFQRIFPIPYVTGTPLQGEQMFVGRQDVFAFVREHLLGTYQNNIIVLHGQRRTGKSSVLYRLGSEMAGTHVCVLVDMQGKAARGEVDFLYSIADDIVYALENKGITVNLPERKEFEESPEFFFRSRFLRGVYDALGDKNLLLMFDEFEELQRRVEDGKLTADIFPYLRNLMQHERRLDFIFAGTHKLEELAAEYWSILFNIAIYHKITFLEMPEITRLVTEPVLPFGMEYDPLAVERIYQVASGHPYFTQVVCHELVAYHNETRRSYITVSDVEAALERILERGEAHFKYIWAESTTQQRLVLMALAERLETETTATVEDIAAVLEHRGRPLTCEQIVEALGNTEARDITGHSSPRSSLHRFRVDLIRRWLYAARPSYEKVL